MYASRLAQPPSLSRWPDAQQARGNGREGWHASRSDRGRNRLRWETVPAGWRRRDDMSLTLAVRRIEAELAAAPRGQAFTSAVERRSPRY